MAKELTSSFDPTAVVASKRSRVDFTPAGGTVIKISCLTLDVDAKLTTQAFKAPDAADGTLRDIAETEMEAEDMITIVDINELETVATLLGGLNGLVQGTAVCYVADPRDATDKVRLKISGAAGAAFAASIRRPDGAIRFGGKDVTKTSLVLRNLSGAKLVPTFDGDAPDTVA